MGATKYSASKNGNDPLGRYGLRVGDFQCHDWSDTIYINNELITVLDSLIEALRYIHNDDSLYVSIYSGYRTNSHSESVGGYAGDQHTQGNAADIYVSGLWASDICRALEAMGHNGGIGRIGDTNVHVDVRGYKCWFDEERGCALVYSWFEFFGYGGYTSTKINAIRTAASENLKNPLEGSLTLTSENDDTVIFNNKNRINRKDKNSASSHLGIDVSGHNHPMNWKKIKEFGVEFAILKIACVGNSYYWDSESLYGDSTVDECIKNEIPFGVYIYSYCSSPSQMEAACSTIREKLRVLKERAGNWFALPCYLDVEEMWIFDTGAKNVHDINKKFLEGIQNKKITLSSGQEWYCPAGIYTTASAWIDILKPLDSEGFYEKYSVWEANLCDYRASVEFPMDIWQYSFTGRIPGNEHCNFDLDRGYFDLNIENSLVNVTSASGSTVNQKSAKEIYEELVRADFDGDGEVTAEDARLILRKSARLLPQGSDEIFKTYNKLIEWSLVIPQAQDELINNFQSLSKSFSSTSEFYISKSFIDFYGDMDNNEDSITAEDYQEEYTQYRNSFNKQLNYNKLSGDLNLDGRVDKEDVALAMKMLCGETTFDSALMIFPKASPLLNCYAIYQNSQNKTLGDESAYYDWQENIFKPYFYEKVIKAGFRDAVVRITKNDYTLTDDNVINKIWSIFFDWVCAQYNTLKIFYRGDKIVDKDQFNSMKKEKGEYPDQFIESLSAEQFIFMDIAKYLPAAFGAENMTDCLSILYHVLGITTLSIEDFKRLNYAVDRELNLYDAYINYLCIFVYVQSTQEYLQETVKDGKEATVFIDGESKELFDYWFAPTADDVIYDEEGNKHGANPFIAFRDIVRAVFSLAPDKGYARSEYESFFGESWSAEFLGGVVCPVGEEDVETFSYVLKSETNEVEFFLPDWEPSATDSEDYYKMFKNSDNTTYTIKRKTLFAKLNFDGFLKEEEGADYKIFKLDNNWYMFNLKGFYYDNERIAPIGQYYRVFSYDGYDADKTYYERKDDGYSKVEINEETFFKEVNSNKPIYTKVENEDPLYEDADTATEKMSFAAGSNNTIGYDIGFFIESVENANYPNLYSVCDTNNGDIVVGQFSFVPATSKRIERTLFKTMSQAIKCCVTKKDGAVSTKSIWSGTGTNEKKSWGLVEGDEAAMVDQFFGTHFYQYGKSGAYKNEKLEDHVSTLFRSVSHDDSNPTHHYSFCHVQNGELADLGAYYPIDHEEEKFYYKNENGEYINLNFNENELSNDQRIYLSNGIVLNAKHPLKKILHENLMVFERIMDWDFWAQPTAIGDLTGGKITKAQEWAPQENKFFKTNNNVPGFTVVEEDGLKIIDHNQAIFFARLLNLMYPGLLKYRKDGFSYDTGWVNDLTENPEKLVFWIDFLDNTGEISKYSVKNIGQRQKVITQDNVRAIKYLDTEKTVFIAPGLSTKENTKQAKFAATHSGYSYFQLGRRFMDQLAISAQGIDAYTVIENMLYNYAQCAESVSMSTIPLYFLEPNSRLQVYNPDTDINSTYVLSKLSIPLGYSGTMSLTMTKALEDNVVREEITKV